MGVILTHFAWIIYLSKGARDRAEGPARVAEQIVSLEQHQKREYAHETPVGHVNIPVTKTRFNLKHSGAHVTITRFTGFLPQASQM